MGKRGIKVSPAWYERRARIVARHQGRERVYTCQCGRVIRGNGYFRHARVCPKAVLA